MKPPTPTTAQVEAAAKLIYDGAMLHPALRPVELDDEGRPVRRVPWVEGGNSDIQQDCRRIAHRIAAWNTRPAVSAEAGEVERVSSAIVEAWHSFDDTKGSENDFRKAIFEAATSALSQPASGGVAREKVLREALLQIEFRSTNHGAWFEQDPFGEYSKLGDIARAALAALAAAPHPTKPQGALPEDALALREATTLAVALYNAHYRERSPNWKPLPDLRGVISQIDNMTTGLTLIEALSSQRAEGIEEAAKVAEDYAANCEKPYRELSVMPEVAANRYNNHKSAGLNIATAIRALKGTRLMDDMERGE